MNPDGVINQIEGGAIQSASWTLLEQVRFANGVVTSADWEAYPILRFLDVPPVTTTIVSADDEPWLGSGEASSGPTAAALGNAVARSARGTGAGSAADRGAHRRRHGHLSRHFPGRGEGGSIQSIA